MCRRWCVGVGVEDLTPAILRRENSGFNAEHWVSRVGTDGLSLRWDPILVA